MAAVKCSRLTQVWPDTLIRYTWLSGTTGANGPDVSTRHTIRRTSTDTSNQFTPTKRSLSVICVTNDLCHSVMCRSTRGSVTRWDLRWPVRGPDVVISLIIGFVWVGTYSNIKTDRGLPVISRNAVNDSKTNNISKTTLIRFTRGLSQWLIRCRAVLSYAFSVLSLQTYISQHMVQHNK